MNSKLKVIQGLIFFLCFYGQVKAQGDLLVFPKRLEFEGTNSRFQNITINNIAKEAVTYSVSFVNIKMGEDGSFTPIEAPEKDQFFATPFLRCYPRTITLKPQESQIVKVQLIKTAEMKEGEYRSHLYFRALPKTEALVPVEEIKTEDKGLGIKLTAIYGITMPIIIKVGKSTAEVSLDNLQISKEEGIQYLKMDFNRKGNMSVFGDIKVNYISPAGISTTVANVKGFAVYSPGVLRKAKIKLDTDKKINYSEGKIEVIYSKQESGTVFVKSILKL